jgi:hypothetical protein
MRVILAALIFAGLALLAAPAAAMNFKFGTTSDGVRVVIAVGEIRQGDARRLARALDKAGRDRHGTKRLYLESIGGLVVEALKMADVISGDNVSTIVRKGKLCASACASILFVAGKYRTVEAGGLLAIHSCYDTRNGRAVSECNAVISAHAEAVGVSGDTMMALQEAAGSDTLIVFEAEDAACFGLTLKPGSKPSRRTPKCVEEVMGR